MLPGTRVCLFDTIPKIVRVCGYVYAINESYINMQMRISHICMSICTFKIMFCVCELHVLPRGHAIPHQPCSQRQDTLAVALSPPPARRCALTHNVAVAGSTARRDAKTDVSKPHAGVLLEKL